MNNIACILLTYSVAYVLRQVDIYTVCAIFSSGKSTGCRWC